MRISQVVQIIPGVPFRSRIEGEAGGACAVVQARDLRSDGTVDVEGAVRITVPPVSPKAFLLPGDIVFQPRGTRYSVAQVKATHQPAIAAAPLYILRADTSRLDPDFLLALLQSSAIQAALRQDAVGTYVPQVPRQAIENLRIELPDLPSQIRLADLARLERRETELMDRLRLARGRLFDLAVKEIAKKSRKRVNAPGSNPDLNGAPAP